MSIEERLFSIADQCRQQQGDAFLQSPEKLTARLSSQAPDLFAEVKALASVLSGGDVSRIEAAADADTEAKTVAQEIATREGLGMAVARTAVAVARRIGPLAAGSASVANASDGWAGDSVVAGGSATPPPSATPTPPTSEPVYDEEDEEEDEEDKKPFWQNKIMLGSAAAVVLVIALSRGEPEPAPVPNGGGGGQPPASSGGQQPPGSTGGQPPAGSSGGGNQGQVVVLQSGDGQLPTIQTEPGPANTTLVKFAVRGSSGLIPGAVAIPQSGWDREHSMVFVWPEGGNFDQKPATFGQAQFIRQRGQNGSVARFAVPTWQEDNADAGQLCVGFQSASGQDVVLSGAMICIMDAQCQQPVACASVR